MKMADTESLKDSEETLVGSSPTSGTKTLWCNTHDRRPLGLDSKGRPVCLGSGITLPCDIIDLTGIAEIED